MAFTYLWFSYDSFRIYNDRIGNQQSDCYIPCNYIVPYISGMNDLSSVTIKNCTSNYLLSVEINWPSQEIGVGEFHFFFPGRVMLSFENYFYSFLSFVAEFGGYLGLLLGVSISNVVLWIASLIESYIQRRET